MYKVLINGKIEEKHIDQTKKAKRLKTVIPTMTYWDITIPLTEHTPSNSPGKQQPTRNRKPVLRYGFEDQ